MHQQKNVNAFLIGVNEVLTDWTMTIQYSKTTTGMKKINKYFDN